MAEFFVELFAEEIPAHMQMRGAETLARLLTEALAALNPQSIRQFSGPRRIAVAAELADEVAASSSIERGPRVGAPEQALAGFLRKHGAASGDLREEGGFYVLEKTVRAVSAGALIASAMPDLLRRFAWPKSMRWGGTSAFTWVRPLRRIVCLLGGKVVGFSLAAGEDDGHGLASADITEGHRFMAPGPVCVRDVDGWERTLEQHFVIASATERRARVADGLAAAAAAQGLAIVEDAGLVDEVCGLVEWPVALLGRIDDAFMDLPPEVMQVSMRVNQRYFATRTADGQPAPWFAFAANIVASDGGAAIVAGNERVLRARFSDARHFWDLDRRTKLADRVAALDGVTFHAELGTQGARVRRLVPLAGAVARAIGADVAMAERAALLCKADLTTGMVGEFPELQGVMGGYYARHDGEPDAVADAVRDHYKPNGPTDIVPHGATAIAVALADKVDQLSGFFSIGRGPTGSSDPFALRRAALGVIRVILENSLHLNLGDLLGEALQLWRPNRQPSEYTLETAFMKGAVLNFLLDRFRVLQKSEGGRAELLAAAINADQKKISPNNDLVVLIQISDALKEILGTQEGRDLLALYKRAANILKIEHRKDGPHDDPVEPKVLSTPAERALYESLGLIRPAKNMVESGEFKAALTALSTLRQPLDAFFETTTVNDPDPALRMNRLRLLAHVRHAMDIVADFSQIEG